MAARRRWGDSGRHCGIHAIHAFHRGPFEAEYFALWSPSMARKCSEPAELRACCKYFMWNVRSLSATFCVGYCHTEWCHRLCRLMRVAFMTSFNGSFFVLHWYRIVSLFSILESITAEATTHDGCYVFSALLLSAVHGWHCLTALLFPSPGRHP